MRLSRRSGAALTTGLALLGLAGPVLAGSGPAEAPAPMVFHDAVKLAGSKGGSEPRVAWDLNTDTGYVVTNLSSGGTAATFATHDGGVTWAKTGNLAGQTSPTIDVDVVTLTMANGATRLVASELDTAGINFRNSYSDDAGKTWTAATGLSELADSDRQWMAVGPLDATSHKPTVWLFWHNLATGIGSHNMFVQTSTDGGESFGAPVPTTLPGSQAFGDLQCSDSGGPSSISWDPKSKQIVAAFGTRTGPAAGGPAYGGCTATAASSFQFNIVSATRVWVVTSPDNSPGSWKQSLAVDYSATSQVVGMQLDPLALDTDGNAYVFHPVSRGADDYAASLRYTHAQLRPDGTFTPWSPEVTVKGLAAGDPGSLLPHVIAGAPGKVGFAYFTAVNRTGKKPIWYAEAAQTLDALSANPTFTYTRLSEVSTYSGTANELMGRCVPPGGHTPLDGGYQGLGCNRSTDVFGVALDGSGRLTVTWPGVSNDGPSGGTAATTWVASQADGPTLAG